MNILFVTIFQISEQKGGTERTTARLSNELRRRGHKCYNLYTKSIGSGFEMTKFDGVYIGCSPDKIRNIINENSIDKIIIEGAFTLVKDVAEGRRKSIRHTDILFVHHFAPGYEPYFNAFHSIWKQFCYADSWKNRMKAGIKVLIHPLFKPYMDSLFHKLYKVAYTECDKIVLLSSEYIYAYCQFGQIDDKRKFVSIPNAVSFDEFLSPQDLSEKEKTVLIVSRLDEVQKRISSALRIWKTIEDDPTLNEWKLKIVGYGESEHDYHKLAKRLNLKRASFEGRRHPVQYYKEASLFMMTSLFEGWPMTLNEACQFGCVPFVYDTCASFHEIINHGVNGYLINDGEQRMYYQNMKELMLNDEKRQEMMKNAIESSTRFTLNKIVSQWEKLLNE